MADHTKSVDGYLGSLSSEELFRIESDLRSLTEHPGWKALTELVELHKTTVLRRMVEVPPESAVVGAHVGGQVKGLEYLTALPARVFSTARNVLEALEREGDGDERSVGNHR